MAARPNKGINLGAAKLWAVVLTLLAAVMFGQAAFAEGLAPVIPKAKGEKCVADTEFMRRNHMTMLKHQRDDTMREGARDGKFALKECVSCHAVQGANGQPVGIDSSKHFCRTCHDYAAVSLDCFSCHNSKPEAKSSAASVTPDANATAALHGYLTEQPQ
jgi:predicted CXXCH cytochrome family protein